MNDVFVEGGTVHDSEVDEQFYVLVDLFAYYTTAEFHGILVQGGASTSTYYGPSGLTKDKLFESHRGVDFKKIAVHLFAKAMA
eukprot:5308089-Heterocapsa_arctica.AAC.1